MSVRAIVRLVSDMDRPTLNALRHFMREETSGTHNFVVGDGKVELYLRDDNDLAELLDRYSAWVAEVVSPANRNRRT